MAIRVRPLRADDLHEADRIFRLAFGTFLGLPDPSTFAGDTDYVRGRWRAAPAGAFAAEDDDGKLAGSVFATCWGSVGFFGPLTVRPDLWSRGVAQRLLEPVMAHFAARAVAHAGLFTFAQSAKHVGLYGKFGFFPRFLTVVLAKPVAPPASVPAWTRFGALAPAARADALVACRGLAETLYPGLDLGGEIRATTELGLGDTVLVLDGETIAGFAVCHLGAGTEAGSGTCYAKFAAVGCGPDAERHFTALLAACASFAAEGGATTLVVGVNLARDRAYVQLQRLGFRTIIQGVAMHRPNEPGYCRSDVYALDDWR